MKGLENKQISAFALREKTGVAAKFPTPDMTVTSTSRVMFSSYNTKRIHFYL
ncbi:hypothetical protein [Paenibacillus lautus]|uniref:hypothetical protein n=1 Tax=Paenibacillus TaxID=44249 RepID=UPI001C7DF7B9|nr:hypothetical protein [Paenibacillus lautus]MBX4146413.1 hypothetical protein [Paenibacillus lautus]